MATLFVRRDRGHADKLRKYRILLDRTEIGRIAEGEELSLDISEGSHYIQARIDWCGTPPTEIDVLSGEQVVVVRSALRGWRIILGGFYVVFNRHGYLHLELQESTAR